LLNTFALILFIDMSGISLGDTESIISDIGPLPNPPVYMPYSGNYNPSHGYQPIQYGLTDRPISSGTRKKKQNIDFREHSLNFRFFSFLL
jgi:hypothetical protein